MSQSLLSQQVIMEEKPKPRIRIEKPEIIAPVIPGSGGRLAAKFSKSISPRVPIVISKRYRLLLLAGIGFSLLAWVLLVRVFLG